MQTKSYTAFYSKIDNTSVRYKPKKIADAFEGA